MGSLVKNIHFFLVVHLLVLISLPGCTEYLTQFQVHANLKIESKIEWDEVQPLNSGQKECWQSADKR